MLCGDLGENTAKASPGEKHGHVLRVLSRKSPFADPDAFEPGAAARARVAEKPGKCYYSQSQAETISYLRESSWLRQGINHVKRSAQAVQAAKFW